ncbi:hypothetical protein VB713_08515 [Anabaena cylindrica UHCC 0172]|uniref:hypothetical protein n=1 Tax=Anabaena cylindrica TaxID=1165 RepID=UPI002B1FE63C|nr:hypothetical protein [Anabaena cylindrica]MEA5551019.1 hypothetical protein [Anabaena cylindrica UHCC 0172]
MTNKQQKTNTSNKDQVKKATRCQQLQLEQLEDVAGGKPSEAYFVRCDRTTIT